MHLLASLLATALLPCLWVAPQVAPQSAPLPASPGTASQVAAAPDGQVLEAARELRTQAQAARERKDLDEARAKSAQAVDLLIARASGSLRVPEDELLFELGTIAYELGDLDTSRAARERVVREREARLPVDDPDLTLAWSNLAVTLATQGDIKAARVLFERVLEVRERTLPADDLLLATARLNLSVALEILGDLPGARALQERVLDVRERVLPPDDPQLVAVRQAMANILYTQGDLPGARALQERALAVLQRTLPADHPDLTRSRASLANTLFSQGEVSAARALQERVVEIRERTLPADHPLLGLARENLASMLHALGELQAARVLQERVLELRERTLPEGHPDLATARSNLAGTLADLGDAPAAEMLFEHVLEVRERTLPEDHPDLTMARFNCALVLAKSGDLPAARALLERVLEVRERTLPPDHPDLAAVRQSLANVLNFQGDLSAGRKLQQRVLEDLERTRSADALDVTAARNNLGSTLFLLGDLAAARSIQERVLADWERTLPAGHPHLAAARDNLSQTLGAILSGDESAQATRGALKELARDFVVGLRRMAQSALLEGSPREVEERLTSREVDRAHATSLACGYGTFALDPQIVLESFLLSESSRAGGLIASRLAARGADDAVGSELRARIAAATDELARLAQSGAGDEELDRARAAVDVAGRNLARHASGLLGSAAALEPTLDALTQGLAATDALVAWRRTTLSSVQPGHPPRWTAVESLIAFVLRPAAASAGAAESRGPRLEYVDLGPIAPIQAAIESWRDRLGVHNERGLAAPVVPADLAAAGRDVRALILDPLRGALQGVGRVVVVLDDALHAIPLDALPAGKEWGSPEDPQRLLGEVLRIEVRSSLIEMLLPEIPFAGRSTLLAMGHPAFDADPADVDDLGAEANVLRAAATRSAEEAGPLRGGLWERGFGTLPETRGEVRGIAQYFEDAFGDAQGAAVVLERRRASREALIELAPKARWLHVATHAWFAPESVSSGADALAASHADAGERVRGMSPLLVCGLALAGANLPVNAVGRIPGLVTAQEISTLDLSNCELAVLSACDTNVGVRRAGQGVASLQKALHMAGARSVITSLWRVPDEGTKELMIDFYRRVWIEKKPKHQALWEAKMKLRHEKDERGDPRYTTRDWAAWVLTGKPD